MTDTALKNAPVVSRWLLIAAFAVLYIVWGTSYIGIHFATETIPGFLMSGLRFLIAGSILFTIAKRSGAPMPSRAQWKSALIAGFLLFVLNNAGIVWAQSNGLPTGISALMIATTPLFFVLIAWVRGTKPTRPVFMGMLIALLGIALLIDPATFVSDVNMHPIAPFVVLVAAFTWALGSLYARDANLPGSAPMSTGMQLLAGGAFQLILSLVTGELSAFDVSTVSAQSVFAMLYLAVMSSVITFTAYVWLMRVAPAAQVATYAYVNPVIALILGALLANEVIGPRTLIAAMVIISGVVIINIGKNRARSEPQLQPQSAVLETAVVSDDVAYAKPKTY